MIVEKIIPRNMIVNLGCASVDNHIHKDDINDYHPLKNVIFIYYHTIEGNNNDVDQADLHTFSYTTKQFFS